MARFQPGQSGNPKGKPKGASDWRTKLRSQIEEAAPDLIQQLMTLAERGDVSAIKLLLDKVLPNIKPESATITIPVPETNEAGAILAVFQSMAKGEVSLDAGKELISALATLVKVRESSEILTRIEDLERKVHAGMQ